MDHRGDVSQLMIQKVAQSNWVSRKEHAMAQGIILSRLSKGDRPSAGTCLPHDDER